MGRVLLAAVAVALIAGVVALRLRGHAGPSPADLRVANCAMAERLERSHGDGQWVTVRGDVSSLLSDAHAHYTHQRFVIRCSDGYTLLIVNDVTLGERVPVTPGRPVLVHGLFVWTPQGGLLHFTHHDDRGGPGGWILYRRRLYS